VRHALALCCLGKRRTPGHRRLPIDPDGSAAMQRRVDQASHKVMSISRALLFSTSRISKLCVANLLDAENFRTFSYQRIAMRRYGLLTARPGGCVLLRDFSIRGGTTPG
jgi:hypothetical protein